VFDAHRAIACRDDDIAKMARVLRESDKLATLGQLSIGLAHELAGPLTSIIAYTADLLRKTQGGGTLGGADDIQRLQRVNNAAQLIVGLTRSFVSYAKPDNSPAPVLVAEAIDQALEFCRHLIVDSKVSLSVLVDGSTVVHSVRSQLIQVVLNLVTNACQAMAPDGGTLTITAATNTTTSTVRIQVDDTGPGILPANLPLLFDMFFTTKAEGDGSGLGLHIVRQIVINGNGTVTAENLPGSGASFAVTLPAFIREK